MTFFIIYSNLSTAIYIIIKLIFIMLLNLFGHQLIISVF